MSEGNFLKKQQKKAGFFFLFRMTLTMLIPEVREATFGSQWLLLPFSVIQTFM